MKIRPESGCFNADGVGLIEVLPSELQVLADYSRLLWRSAYEPDLLSAEVSPLLWARSYSQPALEAARAAGEKTLWVLKDNERVGFVAYRLDTESHFMWLSKLYLHSDYWGRGLGAWVLQRVTDVALCARVQRIHLYVFRRNTRAVEAYQRAGFQLERAELTDLGGGVVYDDYVMVKEIQTKDPA